MRNLEKCAFELKIDQKRINHWDLCDGRDAYLEGLVEKDQNCSRKEYWQEAQIFPSALQSVQMAYLRQKISEIKELFLRYTYNFKDETNYSNRKQEYQKIE